MAERLVQLTDSDQIAECYHNNFSSWGKGLTQEQYLERERVFDQQNLNQTKDDAHRFWAYQVEDDNGWKIVSAMETVVMPALVKTKGNKVEDTQAYMVLSVYTPSQYRGNGYASKMLKAVFDEIDKLDAKGDDSAEFIVLYSDVGEYYGRFGFERTEEKHNDQDITDMQIQPLGDKFDVTWPADVKRVKREDLARLAEADIGQLRRVMDHGTEQDGVPRAAVAPTVDVHLAGMNRSAFVQQHLGTSPFEIVGAEYNGSFLLWVHSWGAGGVRKIDGVRLYMAADKPKQQAEQEFDMLMQAILAQAAENGIGTVLLWSQNIPEKLANNEALDCITTPQVQASYIERDGSMPMVRFRKNLQGAKLVGVGKHFAY